MCAQFWIQNVPNDMRTDITVSFFDAKVFISTPSINITGSASAKEVLYGISKCARCLSILLLLSVFNIALLYLLEVLNGGLDFSFRVPGNFRIVLLKQYDM